ncbi:MAG TPA: glycosyltransferase, partial [Candidatus Polarisedimenticolaceae bacterium]|nr:glycosyltransferase [Candidatus Polarisedimenticolaceae bacterium]
VHPSTLQRWPAFLRKRPRYLLPWLPAAIEQFDFSGYDVVISSSSAFAKGVITKPETLHLCYCHSPMRFVWDYWPAYVQEQRVGPLRRAVIYALTSSLRQWDYYSAARVDNWVANSRTTAGRIAKYYRMKADAVIYPGADINSFTPAAHKGTYFVTLSSLTPYKKIDLAIAACNQINAELVVIGDGPDRERLEQLAGPTIRFAGRVGDQERAKLLAEAKALIFPAEEDFGIAPIEAMASGTAVIAYRKGGLTETVQEGVTGVFFDNPDVAELADILNRFDPAQFKQSDLVKQAQRFSTEVFRKRFKTYVEAAYKDYRAKHHG